VLGHRRQFGLDDEPAGVAVAQDVGDLLGGEHEVDRDQDHPGARRGERQHRVLPAVVRQQRDPISGPEAVVAQARLRLWFTRWSNSANVKHDIAVDDRDLVRLPAGRRGGECRRVCECVPGVSASKSPCA
jgi:hypothetical protein